MVNVIVLTMLLAACGNNKASESSPAASSATASAETSASPSASAEAAVEKTMTDALGHEVKIPANPQRIIASYLEDHLVALGVKPVAQWSVPNGIQYYLQTDLEGIPTLAWDMPFEAVTSFEPDLIIMGSASSVEGDKYTQYSQIAPTYTIGDKLNGDWRQSLLKIGEILNKSDLAEKVLADYEAKANEAKNKLQQVAPDQSVAAIWLVQKQFFVVSENLSSGSVLYKDLGLKVPSVVTELSKTSESNWLPISLEQLAQLDADQLFLINSDAATGSETLKDPVWQGIPAVKNGRIYEYPNTSSWLYTGSIANAQIIDDVLESLVK
ncbi:iron-hydroxamate ABC transporter substrate-binding protein [Cohnella luojiensis]|uniref:Iron-hydroxamate ABC transporter substrate-binding protein n=2 Tax=Cohnella luojiensis TaxID=652876 RepID=A0A4Y8LPP1_9BACL|nr:iron-hydroxamate ABC transporter substrate-binding protein [Cohnella luojiensis]TFE19785.1 iron-hydroxamate ABC transporter substrate-binding protein [Cohnella luojiensis]